MPKRTRKIDNNSYQPNLSCESKRAFGSKVEALRAADDRMLEHIGLELSVYQCHICLLWHLTSIK